MNQKTESIVTAAATMFGRYGFSKTTMGDIAAEAGVSRQTVYNAFPGKEEILRAAVRRYGQASIEEVRKAWEPSKGLVEKIEVFHRHVPIKYFEIMHASPEWADLIEGMHKAASEEVKQIDDVWRAALTDVFKSEMDSATSDGRPAADIVDFFYNASVNAKHGAQDVAHLQRRLDTVKAATLALIG